MAKFFDQNFGDDSDFVDTDPIVELDDSDEDNSEDATEPVDKTNYQEPGSGDSFSGEDPSVFEGEGNPEKPEAQTDQATSPIEIDSQSATVPDGGGTFGRSDDPDAKENVADEETGDDEDDTARPEQVNSNLEEDAREHIEVDDYFDEALFDSHLQTIVDLKDRINAIFDEAKIAKPQSFFLKNLFGLDLDNEGHDIVTEQVNLSPIPTSIKFGVQSIDFNSLMPSMVELLDFAVDEISKQFDFGLEVPDFDDDAIPDEFEDSLAGIIDDDQYEMPGLSEIVGSLDVNDYIGDASLNSLLQEFQYVDAEEDNDLL